MGGSRRSVEQVFDKDFVGEQEHLDTEIEWEYDAVSWLTAEQYTAQHDASLDDAADYHFDLLGTASR